MKKKSTVTKKVTKATNRFTKYADRERQSKDTPRKSQVTDRLMEASKLNTAHKDVKRTESLRVVRPERKHYV